MVRTRSESPRHAQHRFLCQQAPPGPAMEFPDLGAHCSEPSCQRLGEGRSARGAGPGRARLGAAGGAKDGLQGWAPGLAMPEEGGDRSWGRWLRGRG